MRPGGSQTITIHTEGESGVGYDTTYADGKSGMSEGHHGGNGGGTVDENGTLTETWVVAPTAPPGRADVMVLGAKLDYNPGQTTVSFSVADASGACA